MPPPTTQGPKVTSASFPRDRSDHVPLRVLQMARLLQRTLFDAAQALSGLDFYLPSFHQESACERFTRPPRLGLAGAGGVQDWRKGVVSFLRHPVLIGSPVSPAELVPWAPQPREESVLPLSGKLRKTRSKNCHSSFIGKGKREGPDLIAAESRFVI